jgi:hypothetical protein
MKCLICLDDVEKRRNLYFLPCAHYYHKECIETWMEKQIICPICRIPIFIQNFEQLVSYKEYIINGRTNYDLIRRNISTDDNTLALLFVRDIYLFPLDIVEYPQREKISEIIEREVELPFNELYPMFYDESYNLILPETSLDEIYFENSILDSYESSSTYSYIDSDDDEFYSEFIDKIKISD